MKPYMTFTRALTVMTSQLEFTDRTLLLCSYTTTHAYMISHTQNNKLGSRRNHTTMHIFGNIITQNYKHSESANLCISKWWRHCV